jgi:MFS transporter, YNFM family, putative membrane transport protein
MQETGDPTLSGMAPRRASVPDPSPLVVDLLQEGSVGLRRLQIAMLAAGLGAFSMLYSTQALLPSIGTSFGVGPTASSLTVAFTSGLVGLTVLPMSDLAERLGRTRMMTTALTIACVGVAAGAVCATFVELLFSRVVVGLALAGVVAVAMGHIGDEVAPAASGKAIGLYVSGTSLGGLIGRVIPAGVESVSDWRWSLVALGLAGAACTVLFARLIPPSRPWPAQRPRPGFSAIRAHLSDWGIVRLCGAGLLLMGGFVACYNYMTYRLADAPFNLPKSLIGLIFIVYLSGTVASTVAANFSAKVGRSPILYISLALALVGLLVTIPDHLWSIIIGLTLFTVGFFGCHSIASAWVATRARTNKSHASALYLTAYYAGSSIGGTAIGVAWNSGGWKLTVVCVAICYVLAGMCILGVGDRAGKVVALEKQTLPQSARRSD